MISSFLLNLESVAFTTREFAVIHNLSLSSASHRLSRMLRSKLITQVVRGVWANVNHPYFSPYNVTAKLLGSEQGYVSFLTSLHIHGIISQIPASYFIATTGRGRMLNTALGRFEFIQMKPELFRLGIKWSESRIPYLLATPEKALFDTLYISSRKGKRFTRLPEIELDHQTFNQKEYKKIVAESVTPAQVKESIRVKSAALGIAFNKTIN